MLPQEVRDCAKEIAKFYLEKNGGDREAADREMFELRITKLEVDDRFVEITTILPGLLIGRRGENIEKLIEFLGKDVKIIEESDHILNHLTTEAEDY